MPAPSTFLTRFGLMLCVKNHNEKIYHGLNGQETHRIFIQLKIYELLQKLDKADTTKTKLIEAVIKIWFRHEKISENCKKLFSSMQKLIDKVIKVFVRT